MEIMQILDVNSLRALEPIARILNNFAIIVGRIFTSNNGYMKLLMNTIMSQPFLLISVSLLIIGFVIGIIKRMISI